MRQYWRQAASYPDSENTTLAARLLRRSMNSGNLVAASLLYGIPDNKVVIGPLLAKMAQCEFDIKELLRTPPGSLSPVTEVVRCLKSASFILGMGARRGEEWSNELVDKIDSLTPSALRMVVRAGHVGIIPGPCVTGLCEAASIIDLPGFSRLEVLNMTLDELGLHHAAQLANRWAMEVGPHTSLARSIAAEAALAVFKKLLESPEISTRRQEQDWSQQLSGMALELSIPLINRLTETADRQPDHSAGPAPSAADTVDLD